MRKLFIVIAAGALLAFGVRSEAQSQGIVCYPVGSVIYCQPQGPAVLQPLVRCVTVNGMFYCQ